MCLQNSAGGGIKHYLDRWMQKTGAAEDRSSKWPSDWKERFGWAARALFRCPPSQRWWIEYNAWCSLYLRISVFVFVYLYLCICFCIFLFLCLCICVLSWSWDAWALFRYWWIEYKVWCSLCLVEHQDCKVISSPQSTGPNSLKTPFNLSSFNLFPIWNVFNSTGPCLKWLSFNSS